MAANDATIAELVERFSGGDGRIAVYVLSCGDVDPLAPENVRYVGLTCQGLRARLRGHIADATAMVDGQFKYKNHRAQWLRKAISEHGRGSIVITPIVVGLRGDREDIGAATAERALIAAYRTAGAKLTNGTFGGEGIPATDEQMRVTMNERMRTYQADRRKSDPKFVDGQRAANRESARRKYANDNAYRKDHLERAKKRRESDPAFRDYMREYGRAYRARKKAEKLAA